MNDKDHLVGQLTWSDPSTHWVASDYNLVVGGRSNDTRGGRIYLMHSRTEPLIEGCHLGGYSQPGLLFSSEQKEGNDLVLGGDLGPRLAHDLVACNPLPRAVPRSHPP